MFPLEQPIDSETRRYEKLEGFCIGCIIYLCSINTARNTTRGLRAFKVRAEEALCGEPSNKL